MILVVVLDALKNKYTSYSEVIDAESNHELSYALSSCIVPSLQNDAVHLDEYLL